MKGFERDVRKITYETKKWSAEEAEDFKVFLKLKMDEVPTKTRSDGITFTKLQWAQFICDTIKGISTRVAAENIGNGMTYASVGEFRRRLISEFNAFNGKTIEKKTKIVKEKPVVKNKVIPEAKIKVDLLDKRVKDLSVEELKQAIVELEKRKDIRSIHPLMKNFNEEDVKTFKSYIEVVRNEPTAIARNISKERWNRFIDDMKNVVPAKDACKNIGVSLATICNWRRMIVGMFNVCRKMK